MPDSGFGPGRKGPVSRRTTSPPSRPTRLPVEAPSRPLRRLRKGPNRWRYCECFHARRAASLPERRVERLPTIFPACRPGSRSGRSIPRFFLKITDERAGGLDVPHRFQFKSDFAQTIGYGVKSYDDRPGCPVICQCYPPKKCSHHTNQRDQRKSRRLLLSDDVDNSRRWRLRPERNGSGEKKSPLPGGVAAGSTHRSAGGGALRYLGGREEVTADAAKIGIAQ